MEGGAHNCWLATRSYRENKSSLTMVSVTVAILVIKATHFDAIYAFIDERVVQLKIVINAID